MGKSAAQDELAALVKLTFPTSDVKQEMSIGKLIVSHGFTIDEITKELGHRPHRMFIDIYLSSSEQECAFEYNGEQHYRKAGVMSATSSSLHWNQELDAEKAWILGRIGIPLVTVPFDLNIDSSVIRHMYEDAIADNEAIKTDMLACSVCGRLFPNNRLKNGICMSCREATEAETEYDRFGIPRGMYGDDGTNDEFDSDSTELWRMSSEERKEALRERRREAYRQYKKSPQYQAKKEAARQERKKRYQEEKRKRHQ